MSATLDLAFSKAAALPVPAQERISRDVFEHIDALSRLRAEIDCGLDELDRGLGTPLDVHEAIAQAHAGCVVR